MLVKMLHKTLKLVLNNNIENSELKQQLNRPLDG